MEKFHGEKIEGQEEQSIDFSAVAARFENLPNDREREFAGLLLEIARDVLGKNQSNG